MLAAVAERTDLTVLHYDRDFERIAEVTGQCVEAVVLPPSPQRCSPDDLLAA